MQLPLEPPSSQIPLYELIAEEAIDEPNSLLVLAPGLDIGQIITQFTQKHMELSKAVPLILLVNFDKQLESSILETWNQKMLQAKSISKEITSKRVNAYLQGGLFFVSGFILNMDLLTKHLCPLTITGIFINNAHNVTKINQVEPWIITLCRLGESFTNVVGICQQPVQFEQKGNLFEVMALLYLRHCHFWPCFRNEVQTFLLGDEENSFEAHEDELEMTPIVRRMQEVPVFFLNWAQ